MNSTNVYTGIILGAVAGSAVALLDKKTRSKVNRQLKSVGGAVQRYKGHPSEAVRDLRESYERFAGVLFEKTEDTLDLLSTIQETVEMIDDLTRKGPQKSADDTSPSDSIS